MKNQWRLYLGLFFTFMMIVFAILNNQIVSISFGFTTFSGPLILVVFGSVFIGALIVSLMVTGSYWRQNKEIKQLKKQITALKVTNQQQVQTPLVDDVTHDGHYPEE